MNTIGTYISSVVERGFRKLKFRRFGRDDIMTAYLGTAFGEDHIPAGGKVVQIGTTNSNENIIICTVRKADETLQIGEKVIYSTDKDGVVQAKIHLKNDGTVVVNDGEDFAVRYTKLECEFNELKGKFNDLVTIWNTFANAYIPGSNGAPPTASTATQSQADITLSKVEKIKVP